MILVFQSKVQCVIYTVCVCVWFRYMRALVCLSPHVLHWLLIFRLHYDSLLGGDPSHNCQKRGVSPVTHFFISVIIKHVIHLKRSESVCKTLFPNTSPLAFHLSAADAHRCMRCLTPWDSCQLCLKQTAIVEKLLSQRRCVLMPTTRVKIPLRWWAPKNNGAHSKIYYLDQGPEFRLELHTHTLSF